MLFRRGRLSVAVFLAFFGAPSSVATSVAHGVAHAGRSGLGGEAHSQQRGTAGEAHGVEADHSLDHAALHESDSMRRLNSVSVDMPLQVRDRALSLTASLRDRDPAVFAAHFISPGRSSLRADSPRAPPG